MKLRVKHAQAVEQLIATSLANSLEVRAIALDPSIMDYEAIYIVAAAARADEIDCEDLARQISDDTESLAHQREVMVKQLRVHNDIDGTVVTLGTMPRESATALVALVVAWMPEAAGKFCERMEYLHEHPERLGV